MMWDWPKTSSLYYHISPARNRESIMQNGLRVWDGPSPYLWLLDDPQVAQQAAQKNWGGGGPNDVWQVDTSGMELQPDPHPGHPDYKANSWVSPVPVSSDKVRLLDQSHVSASQSIDLDCATSQTGDLDCTHPPADHSLRRAHEGVDSTHDEVSDKSPANILDPTVREYHSPLDELRGRVTARSVSVRLGQWLRSVRSDSSAQDVRSGASRPSFREFPTSKGIRESIEFPVEPGNNFSNIRQSMPYKLERDKIWHEGDCGEYAVAMQHSFPHLSLGYFTGPDRDPVELAHYHPTHCYAHDDEYAYDVFGKHRMPYLPEGTRPGANDLESPEDLENHTWGLEDHLIHKALEHVRQRDPQENPGSDWESPFGYNLQGERQRMFGSRSPNGTDGWDSGKFSVIGRNWAPKIATIPTGFSDMYHVSPRKNRESILQNGLQGTMREQKGTPWGNNSLSLGQPAGNYFFDNPEDAHDYVYNIHTHPGGYNQKLDQEPEWEDRFEFPERPDEYDDWDWEQQSDWDLANEPQEKTDDPNGYDIWKVKMHGHPIMRDPETHLDEADRGKYWNLGDIHDLYQKAYKNDTMPEWTEDGYHSDVGSEYGSEPNRYYSPVDVAPHQVQLHEHIPSWNMTEENFYDRLDNKDERESPTPWHALPMTEMPMPGHESKTASTVNPHKFFTSPTQHERRKRKYYEEWQWTAAADPTWLHDEWIPKMGPYMYHGTTQEGVNKIRQEGIYPHDELGTGETTWGCPNCNHTVDEEPINVWGKPGDVTCPSCGDDYLRERPARSNSEYANTYWEPREGHVYLGTGDYSTNYAMKNNGAMVRVDLRKLDPSKFSADEDHWAPGLPDTDENHPAVKNMWEYDKPPDGAYWEPEGMNLGQWANQVGLGADPEETHYSMQNGSMAYNGHIPPEAVEHVSPYTQKPYSYDENGQPFVQVASANEEYYYHAAPTSERARIMQHGLIPAAPKLNENWWINNGEPTPKVKKQAPAVFVVHSPNEIPTYVRKNADIWRIPKSQVQKAQHDIAQPGAMAIPHTVYPELHQPWEGSELQQIYQGEEAIRNGEMPEHVVGPEQESWALPFEWAQNAERRDVPSYMDDYMKQLGIGLPNRVWGKTAKETSGQVQRRWESLNKVLPNTAETLHNFDNGWTVQKLNSGADVQRTGLMMRNCWRNRSVGANVSGQHRTLNDPAGIPRLAFFEAKHPMGMTVLNQPLQARNKSLTPEHYQMLQEYGQLTGAHVHPFSHYHSMGMDAYDHIPDAGLDELPETNVYGETFEASRV